jgi:hypothetical protein
VGADDGAGALAEVSPQPGPAFGESADAFPEDARGYPDASQLVGYGRATDLHDGHVYLDSSIDGAYADDESQASDIRHRPGPEQRAEPPHGGYFLFRDVDSDPVAAATEDARPDQPAGGMYGGYTDGTGYPDDPGYPGGRGYSGGREYADSSGYTESRGYAGGHEYAEGQGFGEEAGYSDRHGGTSGAGGGQDGDDSMTHPFSINGFPR